MKKIKYTLLISPPGGGKSTWLANHSYDIKIDDISVQAGAMKDLENQVSQIKKSHTSIAIADINLCDYNILQKAWKKITEISKGFEISFEHVLLVGTKEQYLSNVAQRADGREVYASVVRFSPHILQLIQQDIPNKTMIDISSYNKPHKLKN